MSRFDDDTALTPVADGVFEGALDRSWWIVRGPNGGLLAAIVLRGMTLALDDPTRAPRSLTVHYTRPAGEGPIRVETDVLRSGRSLSTVSARMLQDGKLVAGGLAAFATPYRGPSFEDLSMPEVPPPDQLEIVADRGDFPFGHHFDFRRVEGSSERAETAVWMRLRDRRKLDALSATLFMDSWAPAVFAKIGNAAPGVPTIDMTFHFREALPRPDATADDWHLGLYRTTTARDGFIEEDGWLWSSDGRLLAQSRQLALLLSR